MLDLLSVPHDMNPYTVLTNEHVFVTLVGNVFYNYLEHFIRFL
jgi:hypothetical protein